MLSLQAITNKDRSTLKNTTYECITDDEWERLILDSTCRLHDNCYFELFKIIDGDNVIGLINLYAHSPHIISCGPEIKPQYQKQGYAYQAELLALKAAKLLGYTIAVAYVKESNLASIRLHEKLGFELDNKFVNANKNEMRLYIKAL